MAAIVDVFLQFLNKNASQFGNSDVDIASLQEQVMCYTPTALKYSDPQTAFREMPGVIVVNFCKYCDGGKYSMNGLNTVKRIITKDIDDEDAKIQLMLLIHITKMKLPIHKSAMLYANVDEMTLEIEITDRLTIWKDLALKVLAHTQVNETINQLMKDTFGMLYSQRIAETDQNNVSVKFVKMTALELRGFAGINCIYINEEHFKLRLLQLSKRRSAVENENAILIDIATVTLHEYSHVMDDINMSTPASIIATASVADPEFGRISERAFFKVAIHWPSSLLNGGVPSTYVESFLNAIKSNSVLPVLPESPNLIQRDGGTVMYGGGGADLCYLNDLC